MFMIILVTFLPIIVVSQTTPNQNEQIHIVTPETPVKDVNGKLKDMQMTVRLPVDDEMGRNYVTKDVADSMRTVLSHYQTDEKNFTIRRMIEIARQVKITSLLVSEIASALERWGNALLNMEKGMDSRDLRSVTIKF
ncbi:uncharacterized protein LOC116351840 isoform X2 [Contarinia nasturtii]|uniref:uncharacterized protein LOC116351840 isoform X2 n=1 Tax=Contarinia nasturtii TaxID=265458 RepID=UPI0012D4C1A1|nr:uncharacterized protein LOC116351840 isoform X2 [Contarinia nasturtii]